MGTSVSVTLAALIIAKAVLILMYCTLHELVRVIGRDKVRQILFGPMQGASALG